MNAETQRLALVRVRVALETHFAKVRFAHAAALARAGRLPEAEALLRSREGWRDNPSELDLLARIAAKRRDLGLAKALWQNARELEPGNSAYLDALMEIESIECFQDLVSPTANLRRLVKLVRKAGNRLVAFAKAVKTIRKPKSSELVKPELGPSAPVKTPPEEAQASAPIPDEAQVPIPPPEEKPATDAKP